MKNIGLWLVFIFALFCMIMPGCISDNKMNTVNQSKLIINSSHDVASNYSLADSFNMAGFSIMGNVLCSSGQCNLTNTAISPYSLSSAFAVVYSGAKGDTAKEIAQVFYFGTQQDLARQYGAFNRSKEYVFVSANSLWVQEGYDLAPGFVSGAEKYYGTDTYNIDFSHPYDASLHINAWTENRTWGMIPTIISPDDINPLTRVIIENAIYFNASWVHKFKKEESYPETFYVTSGPVQAVMMHGKMPCMYYESSKMKAVRLDYNGGAKMYVIAPDEGVAVGYSEFMKIKQNMALESVSVAMPKFKTVSSDDIAGTLASMGMPLSFSDNADFSGMVLSGNPELKITHVFHKTNVIVDEAGTEAAAATAVVFETKSSMNGDKEDVKVFRADKPFMYIIEDENGVILFIGTIVNPLE